MSSTTKAELQEVLALRLYNEAVLGNPVTGYSREHRLDPHNRIDFLVELNETLNVGTEVKIGSSIANVIRQLTRCAAFDDVHQRLLVTTKAQHHHIPHEIAGKPVVLCSLIGDALCPAPTAPTAGPRNCQRRQRQPRTARRAQIEYMDGNAAIISVRMVKVVIVDEAVAYIRAEPVAGDYEMGDQS